jgi:hypothetical protein
MIKSKSNVEVRLIVLQGLASTSQVTDVETQHIPCTVVPTTHANIVE